MENEIEEELQDIYKFNIDVKLLDEENNIYVITYNYVNYTMYYYNETLTFDANIREICSRIERDIILKLRK